MKTKETKQQDIIEHVQEHALFYADQQIFGRKEPYAVIWEDETFWQQNRMSW